MHDNKKEYDAYFNGLVASFDHWYKKLIGHAPTPKQLATGIPELISQDEIRIHTE